MSAMLKQTQVGLKAYPRRPLSAGELHASWLSAQRFCMSHYLSVMDAKPGHAHQRSRSPTTHLRLNVKSRPRCWKQSLVSLTSESQSELEMLARRHLNTALARKASLNSYLGSGVSKGRNAVVEPTWRRS